MKMIFTCLVASTLGLSAEGQFEAPIQLKADGKPIRVESPGWAYPCWADLDGDGKKDLLVGQFRDGQIKVYKGKGGHQLSEGEWLQAEGKVAQVPGVW